ncbi:MAG: hypothetical protein GC145_12560 [Caulobacter sp.]|nr:hypothetical protein [Caulobacter sp.]
MSIRDSAIEPEALAYARGLLKPPVQRDATWQTIGAAALWAVSALVLAFAMLTAPPPGSATAPVKSPIEGSGG